MAGLNTRRTALAHYRLLNLTKTDLADLLWGIAGRCGEGQELATITDEARIQANNGDKAMARAHKYLADYRAKMGAGHAEYCYRMTRSDNGAIMTTHRKSKLPGWACQSSCRHAETPP